ncbi:uncharacterized protein LOC107021245 [Solanum pennellii]|uniref:Uncharacterized protein LOC107021245 n=1 Tax=Solanum pennellii TaxID=28526 RepID=A0ABM1GXH6_SOLPN|nr:uncharacterized protein LOC107021245 [Solanum pennellii]
MEELPFKYLGVPLSTKKMSVMQWHPLIDRILARINSWTARELSYAGRAQLVQTVLFGVQSYWAQLFIFPAKIIKLIESLCRSYLWSGAGHVTKKALIAWELVCRPKSEGGMGLINMLVWNRAAVAKLCWDLANKEDKLWIKWIHAYYLKGQIEWQKRDQASWMIRKIMNAKHIVDQCQPRQGKGPDQKLVFTLWILLNKKLATVDRLTKRGMTLDRDCVLCKSADESMEHLFIQCHYVEEVWERLLRWINVHSNMPKTWTQFIQWCVKNGKGKTVRAQLFKGILAEGVYGLLNERNKRIFEEKSSLIDEVVKRIAYVTIARSSSSINNVIKHRQI